MGLFKKKADPIGHRAKVLEDEIAALKAKLKKLNAKNETPAAEGPPKSQAKWRSTAIPHGQPSPASAATSSRPKPEVFEELGANRLAEKPPDPPQPQQYNDLGIRKYDLAAFLKRVYNHFRGKPVSNPKLVNYLAAGSIQGLRPLRYEKRVARNRFIFLALVLLLVLWGVLSMFIGR